MKHTPGPWEATTERSCGQSLLWIYQRTAEGAVQKTVYDAEAPDVFPLSPADARLIAAAPELLEAVQNLVNLLIELDFQGFDLKGETIDEWLREPRAAIAKAKERAG